MLLDDELEFFHVYYDLNAVRVPAQTKVRELPLRFELLLAPYHQRKRNPAAREKTGFGSSRSATTNIRFSLFPIDELRFSRFEVLFAIAQLFFVPGRRLHRLRFGR